MKPGASTLPPASMVRAAGPETRPTPAMRPSRTATEPVTDGPPVPSMIRAFGDQQVEGSLGLLREHEGREAGRRHECDWQCLHGADYIGTALIVAADPSVGP